MSCQRINYLQSPTLLNDWIPETQLSIFRRSSQAHRHFLESHGDCLTLAVPQNRQRQLLADIFDAQNFLQIAAIGDFFAGQSQRQKKSAGDQTQNHRRFKLAGGQQTVFVRHYSQSQTDQHAAQNRENKFNKSMLYYFRGGNSTFFIY